MEGELTLLVSPCDPPLTYIELKNAIGAASMKHYFLCVLSITKRKVTLTNDDDF
jgi:hypothetical protein